MLGRYGPAGVLVTDDYEVLQFRGRTAPYLEVPPGAANLNVLKMAREGVLGGLRAAILKARRSGRRSAPSGEGPGERRIPGDRSSLAGRAAAMAPGSGSCCSRNPRTEAGRRARAQPRDGPRPAETIVGLEQELAATREYLQSMIEEHEATNEELKSANEEILSSNEELQTTNEELETAKEELQSTNEELTTVNEELQTRNLELNRLNSDLANLLTGAHIAILMLGTDRRLRRFTPRPRRSST